MWIDAHIHLSDSRITSSHIEEALNSGIRGFIMGGVNPDEWERQVSLARKYRIFGVFGYHPWTLKARQNSHTRAEQNLPSLMKKLREFCQKNVDLFFAVGETGLDYSIEESSGGVQLQKEFFGAHLDFAYEVDRPIVLHNVKSHNDALSMLFDRERREQSGIVHSWSGTLDLAQNYLKLGFYPSIGARVLSRRNGPAYRGLVETIKALKLGDFVIETDAPDQKPVDSKKAIHEPIGLLEVAAQVASLKECSIREVLDASTDRLRKIFRIEPLL